MAKKATQEKPVDDLVLQLNPSDILADDNIRHGSAPRTQDVDRMMASIVDRGGVQEPVSVERIDGAKASPKFRLLKGFIRYSAVARLNKEAQAGLTVPALVRTTTSSTDRLKAQVAENVVRATLSPMDTANSIKKLLDAGVSRAEIREMFARAGTSKGATVSPMSNSWVNIHLNMLDLPADVQDKIHNGLVTVEAARLLAKVPEDRRADVLAKAEAQVAAAAEAEAKDEDRLLKAEQAIAKEQEKTLKAEAELAAAKAEVTQTAQLVIDKRAALRAVQAEEYDPNDAASKASYSERLKAAEQDDKAAGQLDKKAKNKVAKLLGQTQPTKSNEIKEKLEQARKAAANGAPAAPAVGPKDVKKAATAVGTKVSAGVARLSASQIRDAMKDIAKSKNLAVARVAGIFTECFDGISTPKLAMEELEKILKTVAVPAAKPVAVAAKK